MDSVANPPTRWERLSQADRDRVIDVLGRLLASIALTRLDDDAPSEPSDGDEDES